MADPGCSKHAAFVFLYLQTAKLFWQLLGEIQAGTLEQVYLSPLPAWLVAAAGRVLATVLETAGVIAILYVVVFAIAPFHLVWRAQAVVPIAFIVVGSVGYSLIEGGLTLAWKRVELLHLNIIQMKLVIFGQTSVAHKTRPEHSDLGAGTSLRTPDCNQPDGRHRRPPWFAGSIISRRPEGWGEV